ncbi:preprotein translocase subunit SecG [Pelomonas sp. Root1444]|uniref:preprotein translocase subunit SecG n=1 Tax=Pelomonas sp. Root1444 TaxID=1736464 RepID=UPI000703B372|nr:preprotein translocase subunit SecG [Pelomonas sp. Root1444]KQY81089.1 preprotein translocase subunit SecG [Pelomonas sp. Root1444]
MQFFANLVLIVQLLSALAIIGLVLVQHGKGADMGASFGSGASGSLFGATGSANFLSRTTAVAATLFFGCTLGLAFLSNGRTSASTGADTALDRAPITAPAPAASGAAAIPGAVLAPAAPASAAASAAAN